MVFLRFTFCFLTLTIFVGSTIQCIPTASALSPILSGPTTTTTAPKPKICEAGWTLFMRQSGLRCLKTSDETVIEQTDDEKKCSDVGAVLSGIENIEELNWIATQFPPLASYRVRAIQIGIKRKPECTVTNAPASCYPKETNSFYWTDPSVTGTAGMIWYENNPLDPGKDWAGYPSCPYMSIDSLPPDQPGSTGYTLTDYPCNPGPQLMGYVCSKPYTGDP